MTSHCQIQQQIGMMLKQVAQAHKRILPASPPERSRIISYPSLTLHNLMTLCGLGEVIQILRELLSGLIVQLSASQILWILEQMMIPKTALRSLQEVIQVRLLLKFKYYILLISQVHGPCIHVKIPINIFV